MNTLDKLINKFLAKPKEISFQDVIRILGLYGFTEKHGSTGSHRVFTRQGEMPIIVPTIKERTVKGAYVRMIIKRLKLEGYNESEK